MRAALLLLLAVTPASGAEPACPAAAKNANGPCDKKPAAACLTAGDALLKVPGCRAEGIARYDAACRRGELRGCSKHAFRLIENSRDPKVVEKAIALFTRACDGGDALGCSNLASFAWDGEGMPKDPQKAAKYAEKACNAGDAFACGTLGSLWAQGDLGKQDHARAIELFKKACTGGSPGGCNQLGVAYFQGQGAPKNVDQAMKHWNDACRERNASACTNMGRVMRANNDHARAEKAFARACKLGDADACKERDLPPEIED